MSLLNGELQDVINSLFYYFICSWGLAWMLAQWICWRLLLHWNPRWPNVWGLLLPVKWMQHEGQRKPRDVIHIYDVIFLGYFVWHLVMESTFCSWFHVSIYKVVKIWIIFISHAFCIIKCLTNNLHNKQSSFFISKLIFFLLKLNN